jgi:hypothetical protein
MRKKGHLILIFLLLLAIAGCKGEEKGPAQATQEVLASASGENGSNQGAADSQDVLAKAPETEKPKIVFDQKDFDFGEVEAGEKIEHVFAFRNEGEGTLTIQKVRSG